MICWIVIGLYVICQVFLVWAVYTAPLMPDDYDPLWEEDPEVLDFLERADKPGTLNEEDDKVFTVGGLTNDKDKSFSEFQKKYPRPWKKH